MSPRPADLALDPRATTRLLIAVAGTLVLGGLVGIGFRYGLGHDQVKGLVPLFDLDGERNLPTVFALLLLLGAATTSARMWRAERAGGRAGAGGWMLLAIGFVVMAWDETFQLHERLILPMRTMLHGTGRGVLHYAWVVPGFALVLALAPFLFRFLALLPRPTARRLLVAGLVYLAGALGMELVSGWWVEAHGVRNAPYALLAALEESLELAGLILFHRGVLVHRSDEGLAIATAGEDRGAPR